MVDFVSKETTRVGHGLQQVPSAGMPPPQEEDKEHKGPIFTRNHAMALILRLGTSAPAPWYPDTVSSTPLRVTE